MGEDVVSQVGFVELIAEVIGRPVTLRHFDPALLKSFDKPGPVFGQNLVYDCHAVHTTTKLRNELGIRPRYTLAAGLAPDLGMVSGSRARLDRPDRLHVRRPAPRQARRVTPRGILVYYPDPAEARAYADLIRLPSPRPPRPRRLHPGGGRRPRRRRGDPLLLGPAAPAPRGAPRAPLDPVHGRRRRALPRARATAQGVRVTRAAGIFGPWMAEYTLGWCLWVTQRMERLPGAAAAAALGAGGPDAAARRRPSASSASATSAAPSREPARALGMRVIGVTRSGRARA